VKITTKEVRDVAAVLDDIVTEYKASRPPEEKRDWRTYEQRLALRIKFAIRELEPLVDEAIASLKLGRAETRGRKPELTLKQKVVLLLLKRLFPKSNREMSCMLTAFSLLTGVDVGYKTVERLYSDEEVILVLHNIHRLILKRKGATGADCCGDGTGYALTVRKHYASEAAKRKDKAKEAGSTRAFAYSFMLMDLDSRMYLAYGTSFRSEQEAFLKALEMAGSLDVCIDTLRLDRYYSAQKYVKIIDDALGNVTTYLIPKKNATVKGPWKWKRQMYHFANETVAYLSEFYRRCQSESGFSEDKRRLGWGIAQRRDDRVDTANFCTLLWHNMFWMA
jgi:transposase